MKENYQLKPEGEFLTTKVDGLDLGFRRWTWGEKNELSTSCSTLNPMSGFITTDTKKFIEQFVLKTVYKKSESGTFAQFSIEELQKLSAQTGERLYKISKELNLVDNVTIENL